MLDGELFTFELTKPKSKPTEYCLWLIFSIIKIEIIIQAKNAYCGPFSSIFMQLVVNEFAIVK
jgi:hypothetical protein